MAVFQSTAVSTNRPLRGPGIGGTRGGALLASVAVTTALAINDTLEFGYVPADARIVSAWLKSDDIDSGGSPAIAISVGDAGDTSRFFTTSVVGQAGTANFTPNAKGLNATYTTKTKIYGTVTTAAATPVAGNVTLYLEYLCEEPV